MNRIEHYWTMVSSNQVLPGDTNYFIAVFGIGLCSMFETHTIVQDDVDDGFFSHYIVTLNQAVVSSMLMRQKI